MTGNFRKSPVLANPFYLALIVISTLFVMTTLGYLVAPNLLEAGPVRRSEASLAIATWLDRHGPLILGIEFLGMLVTGVLAMITDQWVSEEPGSRTRGGDFRQ
jgi:hypothetical protein